MVSLGNIAPKVGGIKVHSGSELLRDEIIIDVNVGYAGDLKIDIEFGLGGMLAPSASANISNISFTGALRYVALPFQYYIQPSCQFINRKSASASAFQ